MTSKLNTQSNTNHHVWYKDILEFATHIVVSILIFSAIALSAFLLHLLVDWMESHGLEHGLVTALRWVTYVIFAADVITFVLYLFYQVIKFIKGLAK